MALFRKFFYKKPPDGLLEITERVYVFDYCFTTDIMEEDEYKVYIGGIIGQLRGHFPDASFMVFNMREGDSQSQISNILCDYDMTVIDYPRQYEGCPLLTMEMIHHFLRSGENWLQLGQQNVVLMHCERGGWPLLAFMLAALLIYRKMFTGEQKTLDMIYKQAPRELLQLMSPLNPLPSQLRYLQYISRRNVGSEWPPLDRALTLDCVIIRLIPNMCGEGGCRPIFRIYGQDPFIPADRTPKVLFSTPKKSKLVRYYKQADCELVKIDIHCHVQGDVVFECIHLDNDLKREQMMFRVMFNTAFIRSNILMLNRDEIDILWNAKDFFPKNFRVEVLFSDMDASSSVISIDLPRLEEKEGLPVEAFAKVKEIFSNVDWLDSKVEVASVLQQITASNILLERLDSGGSPTTSGLLRGSSGKLRLSTSGGSPMAVPTENKTEPLESKTLSENKVETLGSIGQGNQSTSSVGLSTDSDSTKKKIELLEIKQSLENDSASMVQENQSIPLIEPSVDANSIKKESGSLEPKEKDVESLALKALFKNDTVCPTSSAQGKQSVLFSEPSTDADSLERKTDLLASKEKTIESLNLEALLENESGFKSEPKPLPEIGTKRPTSEVEGKLPMSSFESSGDATLEKNKDPVELKASPENNIKALGSMSQGKQPIPSFGLSTDSSSTEMPIESSEPKASVGNNTKFPTSMAHGDANSMKQKMGPLESKEKDTESLESKSLLETDTSCPPSMPQGKQSIPSSQPSMDANSMKKLGQLEQMVSSENDIKSATSMVQRKQASPSLESLADANSIKKRTEPQELQVPLQLPTQSKIISPRVRPALRSASASYCNSFQGSPVAISRYHSAPSTLGITSVLQDHAPMDIKEIAHAVTISPPPSTLPPSDSKVPNSIEPSPTSVPPASPPPLLPSLPLKGSVDSLTATEKTSGSFAPAAVAPPSPPQCEHTSKLMQSNVIQHPEHTIHTEGKKSLVSPPPSSLPGTSLSTAKVSSEGPPAPPLPPTSPSSTRQASSSLVPPPSPPLSGFPSSASEPLSSSSSINKSVAIPGPPPPPPPPSHSGFTPSPKVPPPPSPPSHFGSSPSSLVPPPPPPPSHFGSTPSPLAPPPPPSPTHFSSTPTPLAPPPPPPPSHVGSTPSPVAPPPPPPPASTSQHSLSKNSTNVPPVPPPPFSANVLSKSTVPAPPSAPGPPSVPAAPSAPAPPSVPGAPSVPGPPSPPFGAKGRGLLRANAKGPQTKRSNLKPYHWLKLTRAMQGSLWAETQKLDEFCRAPEFDMSELESLFSAAAPNPNDGKGGKSNHRSAQKVDKVQLIELRRAYNCEIMLTKVKIPLPELMSAVLALDDSVLDVDQVENLIKFSPTKEEMDTLKNYNGDKENLGKCEQFFLELMKVPRVENKLRVFAFKMQFHSQVSELKRDLNIVNSASDDIKNSVKLKRIMQTILSLGNALNHGTARGSAVGFRLDSLLKLTDTRARNNKMTLMHYLCKVLAEKLPELLDFPKDLGSLEASTKVQLKYLAEEMQSISKGLEKVVQELTASENDGPVSDNFCQLLKEFLSHAEAEVRSLAQLYANVGRNADALALYFGEDPARVPFEQVVSTLLNFVRMFVKAHDENCKQLELEKKKAEKEAENEKQKLAAAKKESDQMLRTTIKSDNVKS